VAKDRPMFEGAGGNFNKNKLGSGQKMFGRKIEGKSKGGGGVVGGTPVGKLEGEREGL